METAQFVAPLCDMAGEIARHLADRLHQHRVVSDAELEDLVDPPDEQVAVGFRHADQ